MLRMPNGQVYMNEIDAKNSVSMTDNPSIEEIKRLFHRWENAHTLIYVCGDNKKIYNREDYINRQ